MKKKNNEILSKLTNHNDCFCFPIYLIGPLVSALAIRYDCRKITAVGSVLAAIGFVLSYFCTNVITLYLTFGVLGGTQKSILFV